VLKMSSPKNAGFRSADVTRSHNQMATRIHLFAAGLPDLIAAPGDGRTPLRSAARAPPLHRLRIKQDAQEQNRFRLPVCDQKQKRPVHNHLKGIKYRHGHRSG